MKQFYLVLLTILALKSEPASSQFSIANNSTDYCAPAVANLIISNPNTNRIYDWFVEDFSSFAISGSSLMIPYMNGTSKLIAVDAFPSGALVRVEERDMIGNLTGQAEEIFLWHYPSQTIPYYYNPAGCGSISVPVAFTGGAWGRWSSWYINGIIQPGYDVQLNGPFFGTNIFEYKMSSLCGDTISTGPFSITGSTVPVISAAGSTTRCNGDSVVLTLQNYAGSIMGWKLNGITIAGTSGKSSFTAKATGSYSVWLNYNNCNFNTQAISVLFQPGAVVSGNSTGCTGDSVLLSCTTATSYQWKLNGNNIVGATSQNIYIKQSGLYSVVTTGLTCNTATSKQVTFYPKATIAVTPVGTVNLCAGEATTLTASGSNIVTYQWYRNNAVQPGANTASLTITKNGTYKCIATNVVGCTRTSNTVTIVIPVAVALPKVSLVLQPDSSGMDSYINTESGYGGSNFGSATTIEVSNYYKHFRRAERGLLKFDLSAVPAGSPIVSATVKFYADTFIVYNNLAQTLYCKRILSSWTENTVNYWTLGATTDFQYGSLASSSILSKSFINVTVTDLVKHWVKIPTDNYGMSIMMYDTGSPSWLSLASSDNAVKNNRPKLTVTYNYADIKAAASTNICTGGSVLLRTNPGLYTYQWFKNGSLIPGATDSVYIANAAGNYKVTIYNSAGCNVTSKVLTVTQNAAPVAGVTPNGTVSFCYASYVWLTADSLPGYTGYQWRLNGNPIAGATIRKYKVTQAGIYTVIVTNGCGVSATSAAITCNMITNPPPVVTASGPTTFCNGQSVTFTANTFAGVTWQWRKSGVDIPGATGQAYTASTAGGYGVRETANGCSRTSGTINVTINCRTAGELYADEISISPQPFSYTTNIQLPVQTDYTTMKFEIRDLQGKIVALPTCAGYSTVFERGNLQSGIYFLHVLESGKMIASRRLMIID